MAKQEEVIFTRVRGLASVVWDPENDRMLAHFNKEGILATVDPRVIKRLDSMGYRRVTEEQVREAGLQKPDEADSTRTPGKGYTHDDGAARHATAFPDGPAHTENPLFDPVDEEHYPTGPPGGKRTLVS